MADGPRGVDFITIDGGEGGTGAGPWSSDLFGYGRGFGVPSPRNCEEVRRLMNA